MTGLAKRITTIIMAATLLLLTLPLSASAASTVINVSDASELNAAFSQINSNGGEFTVSLQADIAGTITVNHDDAVVTVIGNGHSLSANTTIANVYKGTLNLGDGNTADTQERRSFPRRSRYYLWQPLKIHFYLYNFRFNAKIE